MSRCTQPTVTDTIICAKVCYQQFNDNPLAKFSFNDYVLVDDSTYYDTNLISLRGIRWKVFVGDYFFYDFGWNNVTDIVSVLGNGSTYGQLDLGFQNQDIIALFESLPSTQVPVGTKFCMQLDVRDDSGVESNNISNTYCFIK